MVVEVTLSASQESANYHQLEIESSPEDLRTLLVMLQDISVPVEEILQESKRLHKLNPTYFSDYVVPYSGMYLIFYVGQRLSKFVSDFAASEQDCILLFSEFVREFGSNPNCLDGVMKQTILFYASKCGSLLCCKSLVFDLGVNASISDIHRQTALFYAAREGKVSVVAWLVLEAGCDVNHIDRNGQTALFYAAREDRFECVMRMINELGADPLIRDVYKKRARSYLKAQKQSFDFLTEIEKARDPNQSSSHRKLFLVRPDEPLGAAAMTLRTHKPYNPYQEKEEEAPSLPVAPPIKRQRSSITPVNSNVPSKTPSVVPSATISRSSSILVQPKSGPERTRFKVKAPLGQGGLDTFEKEFPDFALWLGGSNKQVNTEYNSPPAKAPTRTPRTPAPGLTPQWVTVVSQLLRGPLWRYGPATIFHKPVLAMPPNLGPAYPQTTGIEHKLTVDLSLVRKKLEKGKYLKLTEIDKDIRSMFQQAYTLTGESSHLGILTKATEIYYEQQLAGSGLAAIIRQESEQTAANARSAILQQDANMLPVASDKA